MTAPARKPKSDEETLFALFALMVSDAQSTIADLAKSYYAEEISFLGLSDGITQALLGAHMHAAYLGRRLAGATQPINNADLAAAQRVMATQAPYIAGLISAILSGKYPLQEDGSLSAALLVRLDMYSARLRGTANSAWVLTLSATEDIYWRLGIADHCSECPVLAENSPYTKDTLPTTPGSGETPCLTNCTCWLETVNGQRGF